MEDEVELSAGTPNIYPPEAQNHNHQADKSNNNNL